MKNLLILAIISATIVLGSCATHAPRPDQITQVPADRLHGYQTKRGDDAEIIVTRDAGALGAACRSAFFIDGKQVAEIGPKERAHFYVSPGEYVLGIWNTGHGLCGYRAGKDRRETGQTFSANETRRFRITLDPGAGETLTPTTF